MPSPDSSCCLPMQTPHGCRRIHELTWPGVFRTPLNRGIEFSRRISNDSCLRRGWVIIARPGGISGNTNKIPHVQEDYWPSEWYQGFFSYLLSLSFHLNLLESHRINLKGKLSTATRRFCSIPPDSKRTSMFEKAIRNINPGWRRSPSQTIVSACINKLCDPYELPKPWFESRGSQEADGPEPHAETVDAVGDVFDLDCFHGWQ